MPWYVVALGMGVGFVTVLALGVCIGARVLDVLSYHIYYTRCEIRQRFLEKNKPLLRYIYGRWFVSLLDSLLNAWAKAGMVQERYASRCECEYEYKLRTAPRPRSLETPPVTTKKLERA